MTSYASVEMRASRRRSIPWAVALLMALGCAASQAHADPTPEPPSEANIAMAQSLFDAGRDLMDQGRYREAQKKFEESNRLDPSAGTLLNLARCLELEGKTGSAWAMYRRVIVLGNATNKPRQVAAAEQYIQDIEPRLARLTVVVEAPAPDLVVQAGDVEFAEASRGVPVVIDPGPYDVHATAPGYEPWSGHVSVREGRTVALKIPPLKKKKKSVVVQPIHRPPPSPFGSPLFITGVTTASVGVVALAIGTGFGVATLEDASRAEHDAALCPSRACTPAGMAVIDGARDKATVATVMLVAGAVAVAGGVTTFTIALVKGRGVVATVVPWVGDTMGAAVVGSW